jgi:hypothetical protein
MPKKLAVVIAAVLTLSAAIFAGLAHAQSSTQPPAQTPVPAPSLTPEQLAAENAKQAAQKMHKVKHMRARIKLHRERTWHWQEVMLAHRTRAHRGERRTQDLRDLQGIVRFWKHAKKHARNRALHPPHMWLWICIHRQEGPWTDNASNNLHWGGLQMGMWFMQTYAPKQLAKYGKANKWPPLMQVWVAERAYAREGYSRAWLLGQWVPTASRCI